MLDRPLPQILSVQTVEGNDVRVPMLGIISVGGSQKIGNDVLYHLWSNSHPVFNIQEKAFLCQLDLRMDCFDPRQTTTDESTPTDNGRWWLCEVTYTHVGGEIGKVLMDPGTTLLSLLSLSCTCTQLQGSRVVYGVIR